MRELNESTIDLRSGVTIVETRYGCFKEWSISIEKITLIGPNNVGLNFVGLNFSNFSKLSSCRVNIVWSDKCSLLTKHNIYQY